MDTSWLNMFHYTHNVNFFSVANCIDFSFLTTIEEVVDKDLIARDVFQQTYYCFFNFFIVDYDTHALTA